MDMRRGFHYRGFHVRFGAYKTHMAVYGYDRRAFDVTVTRANGHKYRYMSGGKGGKKWLTAMLKADIDAYFLPTQFQKTPVNKRLCA